MTTAIATKKPVKQLHEAPEMSCPTRKFQINYLPMDIAEGNTENAALAAYAESPHGEMQGAIVAAANQAGHFPYDWQKSQTALSRNRSGGTGRRISHNGGYSIQCGPSGNVAER